MDNLDKKASEYSNILCNQTGVYSKGEIETAYAQDASEALQLQVDKCGSFGQALFTLKHYGRPVARECWGKDAFITLQNDSHIPKEVVPNMQSLHYCAKDIIKKLGDGSIKYHAQCSIVFPNRPDGLTATNYIPDWEDMLAEDWVIVR